MTPPPLLTPSAKSWLKNITKQIAERVHPEKIVLFGSYAHGKPTKDSDIDLLIVLGQSVSKSKRYQLVDRAIGDHVYPIDIVVRTEKELRERLNMGDFFFGEVLRQGKILYERRS